MGVKQHKPDCQCKFCQRINAKQAREAAAKVTTGPVASSNPAQPESPAPNPDVKIKRPLSDIFGFKRKQVLAANKQIPSKPVVAQNNAAKDSKPIIKPIPAPPPLSNGLWRIVLGAGSLVAGLFMGWVWFSFAPTSSVLALIVIALFANGVFFTIQYFNKKDSSGKEVIVLDSGEKTVPKNSANSLCIYPNRVVFENVQKPQGQPYRCKNDGKYYFLQIESSAFTAQKPDTDSSKWTLKAFILPDSKYYDPSIFATRVLELPAHRRIFRRKETLLEKLSPLMALGGIAIFGVVMLVTLGGK